MRYTIKTELHQDVKKFADNKVASRAYFIPFADREKLESTTFLNERFNSDRVQALSGEWDFVYYENCKNVPSTFDFDTLDYKSITVPSTWQRTGYEHPCYLNTRYQFAMKPPIVPAEMPVGIYRKSFVASDSKRKYTLTFLGAAASIAVYMNGDYVGYSEGSHNMAQFEVSKYMHTGINELLVVVHKWCNGSYMECQDMFRENGIFRDVYITESEVCDLVDYQVTTTKQGDKYSLCVNAIVENVASGSKVHIELYDGSGKSIIDRESVALENTIFDIDNLSVDEWSAEIPNLYTLYITLHTPSCDSIIIRQLVGFKTVKINGEVFTVNGQNVKLKGVNHHDTDTKNGWVMSPEQLERDVRIIKEYNCNTVRMSHYPPDPTLLTLCDVYGLYVVDEADIECHGIYQNPLNQRFGRISNNMIWKEHFVDRVSNMYYRDRNHPSIIMWSLGNEAGGYKGHDAAYEFLKSVTTIPVHYEGVIHTKRHSYDVVSEMYTRTAKLEKIGEHTIDSKWLGKPFYLCEYCHAMGVGPGGLEVYVEMFYKYDNLMGGCIWEFCDHAVEHITGPYKYTYGGDHGELKHDGNFCVDGLFFPDRTPSTGALNMKNVYRPIRASLENGNVIKFTNTNRFKNTSYIKAVCEQFANGKSVMQMTFDMNIEPKQSIDVAFETNVDKSCDNYIVINYFDGDKSIAFEQIVINTAPFTVAAAAERELTVKGNKGIYTIAFDGGSVIYDKNSGEIVSYCVNNIEYINQAPRLGSKGILPNMYRGLIDNDRFIQMAWNMLGYDKNSPKYKGSTVTVSNDNVIIIAKYSFSAWGKIAAVELTYTINGDGEIDVDAKIAKGLKLAFYSDIPRFGVTLEMPKEFNMVEYYGMGEKESLSDFTEHTKLGVYNLDVAKMHEIYVKPQESGNRTSVRYAKVTNADNKGLMFAHVGDYFNFNANHFTYNELKCANHIEDLVNLDTTNVQIDGLYRGAGTQSCGQGPLPMHKPNIRKPFGYKFRIIPIK